MVRAFGPTSCSPPPLGCLGISTETMRMFTDRASGGGRVQAQQRGRREVVGRLGPPRVYLNLTDRGSKWQIAMPNCPAPTQLTALIPAFGQRKPQPTAAGRLACGTVRGTQARCCQGASSRARSQRRPRRAGDHRLNVDHHRVPASVVVPGSRGCRKEVRRVGLVDDGRNSARRTVGSHAQDSHTMSMPLENAAFAYPRRCRRAQVPGQNSGSGPPTDPSLGKMADASGGVVAKT
jgi:hypothetical protein